MKRLTLLLATLGLTFFVSGCGQSGPLYIPDDPSKMAVPPSRNTADDQEQSEEPDNGDSSQSD